MKSRTAAPAASHTALDPMRFQADPWADATIARIMGKWDVPPLQNANDPGTLVVQATFWQPQWDKLNAISKVFAEWKDNESLCNWRAENAAASGLSLEIGEALEEYASAARHLPSWACRNKIARAEELFVDHGMLSVTLLFCASLPQCYVVPDLSAVLQITGQLEKHTEHRLRSTGAMVFPVMLQGGLTEKSGAGLAQIFKVRLIHATIRHLILRQSPDEAMAKFKAARALNANEVIAPIAPLAAITASDNMHHALFANGWDLAERGLPCNQDELAYTLLTFNYVFLAGLRKLHIGLPEQDEEAFLHTWNVVGHFLGIEQPLMKQTMEEAAQLFAVMQARGRADIQHNPDTGDPRPALGSALMLAMKRIIPLTIAKPFPVLMTRYLCGAASSTDLGIEGHVSWFSKTLFAVIMSVAFGIDFMVRRFSPQFSISRFITRLLGYQLITRFMMDQTRPLKLPTGMDEPMDVMLNRWGTDRSAPRWMNTLEGYLTTKDGWGSEKK